MIQGFWRGAIQAWSGGVVEVVDEAGEEVGPVGLVVLAGVVALAGEDGDELGAGLEEAASFADRFVGAVERCGPVAVAVAEESAGSAATRFIVSPVVSIDSGLPLL